MKINSRISLLLLVSVFWSISFLSCDTASISDAIDGESSTETEETSADGETKMSLQAQSDHASEHAEAIAFINEKKHEIASEHVHHSDVFTFKCSSDSIKLERTYNDKQEIHILSYQVFGSDGSTSTKQHYFWDNKLVYQFHHHESANGDDLEMDDHQTYFKDGKMFRCLEKEVHYKEGDDITNLLADTPYHQVGCVETDKLTQNIEKLLSLSEEEAEAFFCK